MRALVLTLAVIFQAGLALAAGYPTSISRTSLKVGVPSDRLSVGLTYEDIKMGVDFDHRPDAVLNAQSLALYAGYDVLPWLTMFATLGASEVDDEPGVGTDPKFKISGGVSAFLWQGDVLTPAYMEGRITLKTSLEISRYDSDSDVGGASWIDATLALPLGYELFDSYPESPRGVDTSLALYIGPALRYIDGTVDSRGADFDFEAKQLFGVMGGADVYISQSLSLGVEVNYFDEVTVLGSVRFHL